MSRYLYTHVTAYWSRGQTVNHNLSIKINIFHDSGPLLLEFQLKVSTSFLFFTANVSQFAFDALTLIVHRVHELPSAEQDKHGHNNLLASYVSYFFNTPGSGTPIASPKDSPSKYSFSKVINSPKYAINPC